MFEVGFTEIILILGIALLVLGPEKLPKLASQVGRWLGRARAMARQLRAQLDDEVSSAQSGFSVDPSAPPSPAPPSAADPATPDTAEKPGPGGPNAA